jgi:hypothetical protein
MANFSDAQKQTAWNKAKIVENDNDKGKVWRKDLADAWIKFTDYGDQESDYGWEVDHAFPESKGGGTEDYNIQAMNWKNNKTKADDFPKFKTSVSSDGSKNIEKEKQFEFNSETISTLKNLYPNNQTLKAIK